MAPRLGVGPGPITPFGVVPRLAPVPLLFDTMTNQQIVDTVWDTLRYHKEHTINPQREYEKILGECVSCVMKRALIQSSEDNITVMMICFKNLLDVA